MKLPAAILLILFMLIFASGSNAARIDAQVKKFKSAVVMDVSSGKLLYSHKPHFGAIPASLVKLMSAVLTIETAQAGHISLSDKYTVSAAASRIGGHQVYLKHGEVFTIKELLKAVVIGSANDAAFAIAEHVAGSQPEFVILMNQRARQLNMKNTTFANAHGLPPNRRKGQKENTSSAYDLALLARHAIKFPLITDWGSTRLDSFRNGTFQLLNTNHRFLRRIDGANGLKTGYHPRGAGFSMVGTATRNGRQLITVVLGAKNGRDRLSAASNLLNHGFTQK